MASASATLADCSAFAGNSAGARPSGAAVSASGRGSGSAQPASVTVSSSAASGSSMAPPARPWPRPHRPRGGHRERRLRKGPHGRAAGRPRRVPRHPGRGRSHGGLEGDELHHPLAFEHQGAVFFPPRGGDGRVLQVDEVVGQVAGPAVAGGGFADQLAEHLDGRLAGLVGVEAAQAEAVVGLEQGGDVDARVGFVDLFVEAVGDEVAVAGGNGETTQQGRIQFRLLGSFHTDGSKKHKPWRSRWCLEGVTGEGTGSYGRGNLDESYCLVRKILKILLRTVPSTPRRLVRSYGAARFSDPPSGRRWPRRRSRHCAPGSAGGS